jgi:hypothetical protein
MNLDFARGAHVCQLHESNQDQADTTRTFLQEGLSLGEYCLHLASVATVEDQYRALEVPSTDFVSERRQVAADVLNAIDWYMDGGFSSVRQARRLWRVLDSHLESFPGVRITSDMRWTHDKVSPEDLCHWEATANLLLDGNVDARLICQYDLRYHSPAEILGALRTHPIFIYAGEVRLNPYYEAPAILENEPDLNQLEAEANKIAEMLGALRTI